jgi:hypothetical protein
MQTFCKNRRHYRKKIGLSTKETMDNDEDEDEDSADEEPEVVPSGSDDEGGTSSAGKRKMAVQGGAVTRKKTRT